MMALGRAGLVVALALGAVEGADAPKIQVGPNILVSRDGDVPHVELMVAASPRDAKHLLGGAMTWTRAEGGIACRGYASTDGGRTWRTVEFPEQTRLGGGDPQVAFTAQGTALFVGLAFDKKDDGKTCVPMQIWRSENGGGSWEAMREIPCDRNWDHEQIVVDTTTGRYAGRIYIGVLYGYPVYRVGVFRSDDDGRTWTGPVEAANGGGEIGINVVQPMVLSDGTLVVPYEDFDFKPEKRVVRETSRGNVFTVLSTDGGLTFSKPQKAYVQEHRHDPRNETLGVAGFPKFGADGNLDSPFRDRIYSAFEDARLGPTRILFSYTSDRGKTWSAPRPIDGSAPLSAHQFQPAVAVNREGIVAVTWFDTRNSSDGARYDQYFAASLDGGASFAPPVRISSESSDPRGAGNKRQMIPMASAHKDRIVLSMMSAAGWTAGGHYMGLAADKDGDFHPFWVDARNGTSQIYTARVKVSAPPKEDPKAPAASKAPASAPARLVAAESLTDRVEVVFDPVSFDAASNEFVVPVRIRNVSLAAIHPPLRLELVGFGFGEEQSPQEVDFWKNRTLTVLNASNGKQGEGAVFDFDAALGGQPALEAGSITNPVMVRIRLSDPFFAPTTRWNLSGQTSSEP
jgi:hypothetical protein